MLQSYGSRILSAQSDQVAEHFIHIICTIHIIKINRHINIHIIHIHYKHQYMHQAQALSQAHILAQAQTQAQVQTQAKAQAQAFQ